MRAWCVGQTAPSHCTLATRSSTFIKWTFSRTLITFLFVKTEDFKDREPLKLNLASGGCHYTCLYASHQLLIYCSFFRPHSIDSFTHRKITLSLADKTNKSQKVQWMFFFIYYVVVLCWVPDQIIVTYIIWFTLWGFQGLECVLKFTLITFLIWASGVAFPVLAIPFVFVWLYPPQIHFNRFNRAYYIGKISECAFSSPLIKWIAN